MITPPTPVSGPRVGRQVEGVPAGGQQQANIATPVFFDNKVFLQ
jgi:hypothetical protein